MSSGIPAPPDSRQKSDRPPRRSSFTSLRHRDFRLLWIGQLVSVTGSQMQLAAINWHVFILTKSPLALGGVGLVRVLPIVLCSLMGGVVADVLDRKRLMLASQSVMLISAVLLAVLTALGRDSVWSIYLLTAIASAAVAFDNPARQSLLPTLVPAEDFPAAVSLGLVVFNSAIVVGPALAGQLLKFHGPALIYGVNAASFVAVIIALLMMRGANRAEKEGKAPEISLAALREGLR